MGLPDRDSLPRRESLSHPVAAGGATGLAACLEGTDESDVPAGNPEARPSRQHAWNAALDTDEDGNVVPPDHYVLLALELRTSPGERAREQGESAFRSLESAYPYDNEGLVFTVGYTMAYFDRVGTDTPISRPDVALSVTGAHDGELEQTLDSTVGHHYGTNAELSAGHGFSIVIESPPQVARHRGYETAFSDIPPIDLTVTE